MIFLNLTRKICGLHLHRLAFCTVPKPLDHLEKEFDLHFKTAIKAMMANKDFELARPSFEKAIETSLVLYQTEPHKACEILSTIAAYHADNEHFDDALHILKKALEFIVSFQLPENSTQSDQDIIQKFILKLNLDIGNIYYSLNDLYNSDMYTSKVIDSIEFSSEFSKAVAYDRLAYIKIQLKDKKAVEYAEKAVKICKIVEPQNELMGVFLCTLGYAYDLCSNFAMSEKAFREGIEFFANFNTIQAILAGINANESLVKVLINQNKLNEAARLIIKTSNETAKFADERQRYYYLKDAIPLLRNNRAARPILAIILRLSSFVPEESLEHIGFNILMAENLIDSGESKDALEFAEKALAIVKKGNYSNLYMNTYTLLSRVYLDLEDIEKSKAYIDLCEPLLKQYPDSTIESEMYYHKYLYYYRLQEDAEAEKYLKISIEKAPDDLDFADLLSYRYSELGNLYQANFKLEKAMEAYEKAFKITTEYFGSKTIEAATCMEQIGTIHNLQKKFEDALGLMFDALDIKLEQCREDGKPLISNYYLIANTYFNMKEHSLALEYAEKLPILVEEHSGENTLDLASIYLFIAEIYAALMNRKKAKEMYLLAKAIYSLNEFQEAVDAMNTKIIDLDK